MRRFTLTILLIVMIPAALLAQQSGIYSQYMFNGLAINPAYAGYEGMLSLTALGRLQSIGLEGSPNTQTFSAHTPIVNDKIGVGLQVFHEKVGVTDQSGVYASYSYKIFFQKLTLALGLQAGANFYRTNYSTLVTADPGDPVFANDTRSTTANIGAGAMLTSERLMVGLSMPQMLTANKKDNVIIQEVPLILFGGYVFDLTPGLKLRPSMLAKMVNGDPVEWNINAHLLIKDILWVGASFRPVNAITMMLQLQISEQLTFGYSYDASIGEISSIESGSHEFMLNYRFRFSKKGMVSPRYF